jgi:CRP/FNR family transcriptional regulator, anaerobic regulatory protein
MFTAAPVDTHLAADPSWFVRRAGATPAVPARLSDLLKLLGTAPDAAGHEVVQTVPVWRVRTGELLMQEGAECEAIYVVRSGALKCFKTSEDGYEQVLSFAAAGEVIGFEALGSGRHPCAAVALEDAIVFALPLHELDRWRAASPAFDRALQLALSRRLARAVEVAEMMAPVAAEARLSRFLLWLSDWMVQRGQSPRRLLLRMSRRDIASLLGVAHETVSRSFTALADWGCLKVEIREVEILDMAKLRACARNTRGLPEDLPPHGAVQRRRAAPRAALAAA